MNRFLTKKKGKEDVSGPRPSIDSESSGPFRMFGKNKKTLDEEPKAEVDLTNVLPSSDDFRTSLIMTGLSARFSMLREQDDPNTKVGKASDDSVLFPKRQSKLLQFGFDGGLRDITEVESLKSNGYDALSTEDTIGGSSIMNRGKPTEGNNLFGGRQKIYRIPANGAGVAKDGAMPGRALYDDDVALSGFQKWRLAEKEKRQEDDGVNSTSESDSQPTSSRRQTSSTTSSVPPATARNSTAETSSILAHRALSVKEPQPVSTPQNTSGLERSVTRTRRLYEQGLNRELIDQQSSALSRMNSLSTRAFGTLTPDVQSPISGSFGDRRQILAKASAPNLRSFTPSTTGSPRSIAEISGLERSDSRSGFGANPPLSPPVSEAENPSFSQKKDSEVASVKPKRNVPVDIQTTSFFDDSDAHSLLNQAIGPPTPQLALERPDDDDHPAFRKSALPTPLTLAPKISGSITPRPEDSPTLGPNTGGLSGMVRAHLRSGSNASSIYDTNQEAQNGQSTSEREVSPAPPSISSKQTLSRSPSRLGSENEKEQDDFARHLADGARRVREKLTTYVDADPDRAIPLPSSPVETPKELNPPRPTLGLLRSKSSRGSLFDRESRDQARTLKTAISSSNISVLTPSPRKTSAEADDLRGRSTLARDQAAEDAEKDDNVHVGLKAFRQARRELQKVKEMDTPPRYQSGASRPQALRAMSYDTSGPSPYNRMPLEDSRNGIGSRSGSRAPSERDRSGSDTSNGGRPSRMRNGSSPEDHIPPSPNSTRRMPYMTNGTDYRPRNGSSSGMLPATASTPNLHAPVGAPPLPPINPRRKGGLGRAGEDDSPLASPRMPGGFPGADDGSDDEISMEERRQRLRRATSEGNSLHGRARNSPPRNNARPPLPQNGLPNGRTPGGMI